MDSGLERIFGSPVWGDHNRLSLTWSDDQLMAILNRLEMLLPDSLTTKHALAAAAVVRSLVLERKVTGRPLRYSRVTNHYSIPRRYRTNGPYYTYRYVTGSMDVLLEAGLVGQEAGVWGQGGRGRQSVAWPTDFLMEIVGDLVDVGEQPGLPGRTETVVLRDAACGDADHDTRQIDYFDSPSTLLMRADLELLNHGLAELPLFLHGERQAIPVLRRIFNGSLERCGRLYCHGNSYQNIPSRQRAELQVAVDGQPRPVVEVDYSALHITMAYTEACVPMPPGDQYDVGGYNRDVVKLAVNVIFNAANREGAIHAIGDEIWKDESLWLSAEMESFDRVACRNRARGLVTAIENKHWRIKDYFHSDCGARFQRRDSDIAVDVMMAMARRTGRWPLPVHDSFIVADIDGAALVEVMRGVASRHGLPLHLKGSLGHRWLPLPPRHAIPPGGSLSTWHNKPLNSQIPDASAAGT